MPVRGRKLCFHKKRILWLFPSELGFHCTNCKSRSLQREKTLVARSSFKIVIVLVEIL